MDIAAARSALPGLLRAAFGERVTITPMRDGKMTAVADPSRAVLVDVPARYDLAHDFGKLGGEALRSRPTSVDGEAGSISIEIARLPALPRQGDMVTRINPHSGSKETYRIARMAEAHPGVMLFYLQRI